MVMNSSPQLHTHIHPLGLNKYAYASMRSADFSLGNVASP